MATEILLLADVVNLGKAGDVVKVKDGYARNFLLPKDLAAPVSQGALRRLEKMRKEREELSRIQLAEAKDKAAKLSKVSVTLREKVVEGTHLYGSVHVADILKALEADSKIALDKSQIALAEPIKETGSYDVAIKLHPEVSCTIKVWVVEG
jgi:large subunit ribosomal protein L9